jgi:hypothetical protein
LSTLSPKRTRAGSWGGQGGRAAQFTGVDPRQLLGLLDGLAGKHQPITGAETVVFVDVVEAGQLAFVLRQLGSQVFEADGLSDLHPQPISGGR